MTDSSSDGGPEQDLLAHLFEEIDAGRLTIEEAAARHPELDGQLRGMQSLRRLLQTAQTTEAPDAPKHLGEFKIVGIVGQGGMGVVYRAYHERLQREVAVKTIRPTHVTAKARDRFLREQTALARLHQTHIVPIYAAGSDGAVEYFVMPYIEGATLHHVLATLRRGGPARGAKSGDTLFSLVQTTAEQTKGSRGSASFASLNGNPSALKTDPPPPSDDQVRPPASEAYFRSAATIIAAAAEAIEHAHRRQVFHRDLKPSNLMLAADGRLWIIDFGLAAFLPREREEGFDLDLAHDGDALTNAAVGTWSYMAPEQFRRVADARTDVWGLGVTLYEVLTLRRAFAHRSTTELQRAIEAESPPHPAAVVPSLSADLAAICWKAMAKDPGDRYRTAGELAEDLRRWLRGEPVAARPRRLLEQAGRWAVRHRTLGALIVSLAVAVPTIIGLQWRAGVKARAELAEQGRQILVRDFEALLRSDKVFGWSSKAVEKITEAAAVRKDATVRDAALGALAGLDAHTVRHTFEFGASSAAYDAAGKRLVLGGTRARPRQQRPAQPARVWDLTRDVITPGKAEVPGLVAFRRDGAPVQLVADKAGSPRLLDVLTGATLKEYSGLPVKTRGEPPTAALDKVAERVAVSFPDEHETFVWTAAGSARRLPVGATALAFSLDGALVALGSAAGETTIWSVADGKRLGAFTVAPRSVQALAFSGRAAPRGDGLTGEVAVGSFGRCAVVDLATARPTCFFETDEHVPKHLEFAPNGATIGADSVLFDVSTGQRLLQFPAQMEGLAFSPDGAEVCQVAGEGFTVPQVIRLSLSGDRGVAMLNGLSTRAARLAFSADGGTLAALSRDWRLAVWRLRTGRLVRTIDVPEGPFADNAAVALSEDGVRVAVVSGTLAGLWNVDTGKRLREWWHLPPAISNGLAFTPTGELLLVRHELKSMADYPSSSFGYPDHPRIVRGRNLLGAQPLAPLYELNQIEMHVYGVALTPDGARLLADGLEPTALRGERSVRLFDARTGREVRRFPLTHTHDYHSARTDPTGGVMMFHEDSEPTTVRLISAVDGTPLDRYHASITAIGPGGSIWLGYRAGENPHLRRIYRRGRVEALHNLSHFTVGENALFSPDGRFLAFETATAAVGLLDLAKVEEQLSRLGLR